MMTMRKSVLHAGAHDAAPAMSPIDRPRLPHTDHKCREVVHGPHEDRAESDPQDGREPSPDHGDRGANNRRRPGDRGEVVTPQHVQLLVGR